MHTKREREREHLTGSSLNALDDWTNSMMVTIAIGVSLVMTIGVSERRIARDRASC